MHRKRFRRRLRKRLPCDRRCILRLSLNPTSAVSGHKIRLAAATAAVASGGTMLIIAKGFPNQFRTTDQEMAASDRGKWFPSVDDFRATAASSGGSGGEAATFAQLLEVVGNQ